MFHIYVSYHIYVSLGICGSVAWVNGNRYGAGSSPTESDSFLEHFPCVDIGFEIDRLSVQSLQFLVCSNIYMIFNIFNDIVIELLIL